MHVAVNYNYLVGFRYDDGSFGRDGTGTVAVRRSSTSGRGHAIDIGVGATRGRVTMAAGVNRIGNAIDWSGGEVHVDLPVDARAGAAYDAGVWTAIGEIGTGLGGAAFHAGVERRVAASTELRAGARYALDEWNPTGGIGINFTPSLSLDVAAFGTSANLERRCHLGVAASLRISDRR